MPAPVKLDRLVTGISWFDDWVDTTLSAIERALNISSSGPIVANVRPEGLSLSFVGGTTFAIAKSGGSGIGAISGSTPGSANVTLYSFDGSAIATETTTVKAYNLGSSAVGNNKMLILCLIGKWWFVLWEDCG